MLILASATDKLQVVTSSTANVDVHASWLDLASGAVAPGRTNTATIVTATTTDVVGSPAVSTQRNVKFLSIRNRHASAANDVTVKHTDGTNALELIKCTLQAGEELLFVEGGGFVHLLPSGAVKTGFDPNAVAITGGTLSGVDITTVAGAAGGAPFTFMSGVLATVPAAGDMEYDGVVHYATAVGNERGVNNAEQFISMQGGTFTLTSQTAAQKLFNNPANGAVTLGGARSYQFECQFDLSAMSATSGAFGFALAGTATLTYSEWYSLANKAALATAAAPQSTANKNSAANTAICTATTNTVGWAWIRGLVRVNVGGTLIPQVSLGIAAAAVVGQDSWFRLWPIGSNTVRSVGNWS